MIKTPPLRACPWCGFSATIDKLPPDDFWTNGAWHIHCTNDPEECQAGFIMWKKEECVEQWNDEDLYQAWTAPQIVNIELAVFQEMKRIQEEREDSGVIGTRDFDDFDMEEFLENLLDWIHENAPHIPGRERT